MKKERKKKEKDWKTKKEGRKRGNIEIRRSMDKVKEWRKK